MKHYHINIDELRELWNSGWLVADLAKRYGCTQSMIYWLRQKYRIKGRPRSQCTEPPPPSPEDAAASEDSLALSPWVAARAEQFRRQKERDGEPMRVMMPVTSYVGEGPRRRYVRYA